MGDALSAQGAVGILNAAVMGDVNGGVGAGVGDIPHVQALDLVADLDAAHTFDALGVIPNQGEILFPGGVGQHLLIGFAGDAKVVGDGLQGAIAAADAGRAVAVVLGEDKLHIGSANLPDLGAVGVKDHPLLHYVVAGGDELLLALQLHHADAAGADFIYFPQVAQAGNGNSGGLGRVEDSRPLWDGDLFAVYGQSHHFATLPPLNTP